MQTKSDSYNIVVLDNGKIIFLFDGLHGSKTIRQNCMTQKSTERPCLGLVGFQ